MHLYPLPMVISRSQPHLKPTSRASIWRPRCPLTRRQESRSRLACSASSFMVSITAQATVTLTLPLGISINTYYKYGHVPTDPNPEWYDFTANAQFLEGPVGGSGPESVVLTFTDGQTGDDDLNPNGVIVDPGALGLTVPNATITGPAAVTRGQVAGFTVSANDLSSSAKRPGLRIRSTGMTAVPSRPSPAHPATVRAYR